MILRSLFLAYLFLAVLMGRALAQGDPPPVIFQAVYLPNGGSQQVSTFAGGPIFDSYPITMRKVPTQWAHRLRRVEIEWEYATTITGGDFLARYENLLPTPVPGWPQATIGYIGRGTQHWLTWLPTTVPALVSRPDLTVYGSGQFLGEVMWTVGLAATDGANWSGPDYYWQSSHTGHGNPLFNRVQITSPARMRRFCSRGPSEWVTPLHMSPREDAWAANLPDMMRWQTQVVSRWGTAIRIYYHFQ